MHRACRWTVLLLEFRMFGSDLRRHPNQRAPLRSTWGRLQNQPSTNSGNGHTQHQVQGSPDATRHENGTLDKDRGAAAQKLKPTRTHAYGAILVCNLTDLRLWACKRSAG